MDTKTSHPRGWNTDFSTKRKIRSYEVERCWYEHWSKKCKTSRVAKCHATHADGSESLIVLEDLDASGFAARFQSLDKHSAAVCLKWLARFHGFFLGSAPDGLWPTGTYWHLGTRPDEFAAMPDSQLKTYAHLMDDTLSKCTFQTLVHGDAKVANFCFSPKKEKVAVVDFQYVGKGCGMKDVAYFLGSCLDEEACGRLAPALLDVYFDELKKHIKDKNVDKEALELEWRRLYPVAWTDFYRFLAGWMPTHSKIHDYTKEQAKKTFSILS